MDHQSLLNDYIDGVISPENEDVLFREMSYDRKLRHDFQILLDMDRIPEYSHKSSFIPPLITENIFNTLDIPVEETVVSVKPTSGIAKYFQTIATSVITFAVSFAVFYFIQNDNKSEGKLSSQIPNQNQSMMLDKAPITNFPKEKDDNQVSQFRMKTTKNKIESYKSSKSRNLLAYNQKTNNFDYSIYTSKNDFRIPSEPKLLDKLDFNNASLIKSDNMNRFEKEDKIPKNSPKRFALQLSGVSSSSLKDELVKQNKDVLLPNTALAFKYSLDDKFNIGIEGRNENFYLDYKGNVEGKDYFIYQNTNYISLGAVLEYNTFKNASFSNTIKVSAGYNKLGPIFRFGTELEYSPNDFYSFVLGCEGSSLIYNQTGKNFFSNKLSILYGIKLRI